MNASFFRCLNPFPLTLAYELAFGLGYVAEKLKNYVSDQCPGQVAAIPCIEQGHIQNNDMYLFFFCNHPPLLQNFIVIPAESVDALDHKHVARPDLFHQF